MIVFSFSKVYLSISKTVTGVGGEAGREKKRGKTYLFLVMATMAQTRLVQSQEPTCLWVPKHWNYLLLLS